MKKKAKLKTLPASSVRVFKIVNRRGYAALCKGCLTEGRTPYQTYERMNKALKRTGHTLNPLTAKAVIKLVRKNI